MKKNQWLQELQSQVKQMASTHRLAEAAWQEERRADQAASTQREKNFQKAIVRLQRDLEAARAAYDAQAKSNGGGAAAGSSSSPAGSSLEHSEWVPVQFASPPLASADAAALRRLRLLQQLLRLRRPGRRLQLHLRQKDSVRRSFHLRQKEVLMFFAYL